MQNNQDVMAAQCRSVRMAERPWVRIPAANIFIYFREPANSGKVLHTNELTVLLNWAIAKLPYEWCDQSSFDLFINFILTNCALTNSNFIIINVHNFE